MELLGFNLCSRGMLMSCRQWLTPASKDGFFLKRRDLNFAIIFRPYFTQQDFSQEFTCYQKTSSPIGERILQKGCANGIVGSLRGKVMSFLLYSKGRKLASFQVGYPDWKSTPTLSSASSSLFSGSKFLQEACVVCTCWLAHTQQPGWNLPCSSTGRGEERG